VAEEVNNPLYPPYLKRDIKGEEESNLILGNVTEEGPHLEE